MTTPGGCEVKDRRPIRARRLRVFAIIAERLAAAGFSPNAISLLGLASAAVGAGALLGTAHTDGLARRLLWVAAALGAQGRLLANLLDGMVALAAGTASAAGELFNEVPDRASDVLLLAALGYASGGVPAAGWAAAVAAVLTAYVRAVGQGAGLPADFGGPMAKQQRMLALTLLALFAAIAPDLARQWRLAAWVAGIIAAGSLLTAWLRLRRIHRALRQ